MKTKTIESRLSIYKDRIPEVQKGVFKDEYKWWLLSLSLSCSFLGFFFFGSRGLFVVVVVVVINCINICLAFLHWSFGKLFGFKLTSCIQSSVSIGYNIKNTWFLVSFFLSSKFSIEFGAYSKRRFFIYGGVKYSSLAIEFDGEKGISVWENCWSEKLNKQVRVIWED